MNEDERMGCVIGFVIMGLMFLIAMFSLLIYVELNDLDLIIKFVEDR